MINKRGDIMAVSEAQKRASNKYNAKYMAVVGCKLKKEEAEKFKNACINQGTTANNEIKKFVLDYISKNKAD